MSMMSIRNVVVVVTAMFVLTCTVAAQEKTQAPPAKVIKHVPVKAVSPASGKEMYMSYCAVCHGTDGKGGGPAASALKTAPTNLTLLSKTNEGKYPALKVAASIRGEDALPAHGSKEMPVWGKLFWSMSSGHHSEVQQRVVNLNQYIESIQQK
ncbi:MAG: c-type cytochrome [Acidobacteriia bacterium]|nr:c-type cytochrome [Terriglobia bacterium]